MHVGLQIPDFTWPNGQSHLGADFAQMVDRAEAAGFYSLWVMDHFFQIGGIGSAEREMLEGWSALAFAAGRTRRIKLGTMVTGVTYRFPGILVKTGTTLDVLSQGRAYFGIGAAWNEEEHAGPGVPFPPTAERFERLEETLQIALRMWADGPTTKPPYEGKHYQLARPLNSPQSVQRPHPPIRIGGSGERKTLRLVAQYGDACNFFARMGHEALQHKCDMLRDHCQAVGRPYEQIEKTTLDVLSITRDGRTGTLSPAAAIDCFGDLAAQGIDHAIFSMPNVTEDEPFEVLATQVIPEVEKLPVARR